MISSKRARIAIIAMVLALILIGLTFLLPATRLPVVFFERNSEYYPFTIQNLMWIFFFIGLGEVYCRLDVIRAMRGGIAAGYLSEEPDLFYDEGDLLTIRKKIHGKTDLVARLIDVLTIRYQVSQYAVDETHQMLNTQLELIQFRMDVDYSMLRYISWLLPSLGFLGTVLGISNTLAAAGVEGAAQQPTFLHTLTTSLALAFDTTLLGLIMSTILVYLIHIIQSKEENGIGEAASYILNNLVNKLISNYDKNTVR